MTFSHLYTVHFDHLHFPFSLFLLHFCSSETVKGRISGNPKVLILCSLWGCFSQSLAWGPESLSGSLLLVMRKIRHRLGVPSYKEQRRDRMPNGGLCDHPQIKPASRRPAHSCLIFTPFPIPSTRHLWATPGCHRATWGYSRSPSKGGWGIWNVFCMSSCVTVEGHMVASEICKAMATTVFGSNFPIRVSDVSSYCLGNLIMSWAGWGWGVQSFLKSRETSQ